MYKKITTPLRDEDINALNAGDRVLLSGVIYTARDAAHKRMHEALQKGQALPIDIRQQVMYYAGPCPARPGMVAGPFGPTTSGRMDKFAPELIAMGLKGMIGKGDRTNQVVEAMKEGNAVYFAAIGGIGAYIAATIKSQEVIAYEELGAEALIKLEVSDLPLIVAIDSRGNNLYLTEPLKYKDKFTEIISDKKELTGIINE
ncbi:MAG TPA: Fe-S-containing hydro-lyase [Clostridia bacterium]|nr:Fe-S-containing hydro-lyase [Clostridia bacterium]